MQVCEVNPIYALKGASERAARLAELRVDY